MSSRKLMRKAVWTDLMDAIFLRLQLGLCNISIFLRDRCKRISGSWIFRYANQGIRNWQPYFNWSENNFRKTILIYRTDSSSVLVIGVHPKYFQGFSTCIPYPFSIGFFLAGRRLQALTGNSGEGNSLRPVNELCTTLPKSSSLTLMMMKRPMGWMHGGPQSVNRSIPPG